MKTLIINIATALGDASQSHIQDYSQIEQEYLSSKFNTNVDIFIFLFISNSTHTDLVAKKLILNSANKPEFQNFLYGEKIDIGNPTDLSELFTSLVKKKKYTRKILSTWDHGFGYFMFNYKINPVDYSTIPSISLKKSPTNYSALFHKKNSQKNRSKNKNLLVLKKGENLGLINPENPITLLSMNELRKAIQSSKLKKFDLIIMSNCYMQTIDTAYALRNCASFLIAPQSVFPWKGYFYSSLLKIEQFDNFEDYCKNIIKESFNKIPPTVNDPRTDPVQNEVSISLLVLDNALSFFRPLFGIIKFLIENYGYQDSTINFRNEIAGAAICCKDLTVDYTNIYLIDLFDFLDKLNWKFYQYVEFYRYYDKIKPMRFVCLVKKGNKFSDIGENKKIVSSGLSINFPLTNKGKIECQYFDDITKPDAPLMSIFSKDSNWGNFLVNFLY